MRLFTLGFIIFMTYIVAAACPLPLVVFRYLETIYAYYPPVYYRLKLIYERP